MPKVPSENHDQIVAALKRLNFRFARQRGSHIRLERTLDDRSVRISVPAHKAVKRSTLSRILKQPEVSRDDFLDAPYNAWVGGRRVSCPPSLPEWIDCGPTEAVSVQEARCKGGRPCN